MALADRASVVFLFVQEELLFRYPLHNPFTVDLSTSASDAVGSAVCPTTEPDSNPGTKDNFLKYSTVTTCCDDSASREVESPRSNSQQRMNNTQSGVCVRHKPRNPKRVALAAQLGSESGVTGTPGKLEGSCTASAQGSTAEPPWGNNNPNNSTCYANNSANVDGDDSDTCVGIRKVVLLHLLRSGFTTCTTIRFGNVTFLVYPLPLVPMGTQRVPAADLHCASDNCAHGVQTSQTDYKGVFSAQNDEKEMPLADGNEKGTAACCTHSAVLVVAMNRPDRDDSAITNFVQVFVNVLVREELRVRYVSQQVRRMKQRLSTRAANEGDTMSDVGAANVDIPMQDATSGAGGGASFTLPPSRTFAHALGDRKLTLCREMVQLVQCIAGAPARAVGDCLAMKSQTRCPQRSEQRRSYMNVSDGITSGNDRNNANVHDISSPKARADVCSPAEFAVRGLLALPTTSLLDGRDCKRSTGNTHLRLNPNYVVALADPHFVERLAKPYAEKVGRRASHLLPLAAIRTALDSLSPPWRIGTLYRALEQSFIQASQNRQMIKKHQSNSLSRTSTLNSVTADEQSPSAEADILVVEAVEFLRMSDVLEVKTGLTIVFTHCDILCVSGASGDSTDAKPTSYLSSAAWSNPSPPASGSKTRGTGLVSMAPASMLGVMLFAGLQRSSEVDTSEAQLTSPCHAAESIVTPHNNKVTTGFGATAVGASGSSTASGAGVSATALNEFEDERQHFEVYCAWGDACSICEELAAAKHIWHVNSTPVHLTFPFLSAAVLNAARRRSMQGTYSLDPECFRLICDQGTWPVGASCIVTGKRTAYLSPQQTYRGLTHEKKNSMRGEDAAVLQIGSTKRNCATCRRLEADRNTIFVESSEKGNAEVEPLVPGAAHPQAQKWLAANFNAIDCRLHWAQRQRLEVGGGGVWHTAARHNDEENEISMQATSSLDTERSADTSAVPLQQTHSLVSKHCYRRREPSAAAGPLPPPQDAVPSLSTDSLPRHLENVHSDNVTPALPLSLNHSLVPFETLMQFVFHHVVVLLWGRAGMSVEVLVQHLERNLRRLRPFLARYKPQLDQSNVRDRRLSPLTAHWPPPSDSSEETDEDELQFQEAYTVFSELSLVDVLEKWKGASVEVVPTRLLLHTVVNLFSDVLLPSLSEVH
ncbi:hypothetical protein ERJ75_001659000 [Trypanosoma vivax]|nr:hypothetical protein ERJ75_001659000 [Trypanosoma vivax]